MSRTIGMLILILLVFGDGAIALVAAIQLTLNWRRGRTFVAQAVLFFCLSLTVGGLLLTNGTLPQPIKFTLGDMHQAADPTPELAEKLAEAERIDGLWAGYGNRYRLTFLGTLVVLSIGVWPASVDWLVTAYGLKKKGGR